MADGKSSFVYVTYIRTTPDKLWEALTISEFMKQYCFGMYCESHWKAGSSLRLVSGDGQILDAGEIVEAEPPRRLVIRWQHQNKPELKAEGESLCTMELEPMRQAVRLSVTHTIAREPSKFIEAVSGGWLKIISNIKSLLETGAIALQDRQFVQSVQSGKDRSTKLKSSSQRSIATPDILDRVCVAAEQIRVFEALTSAEGIRNWWAEDTQGDPAAKSDCNAWSAQQHAV
jgi:uncharacterized protein YndB with AHSA1/START domain